MQVCNNFGGFNTSNEACQYCKVTMSCKREKIKLYKSTRKEKVVRRNLNSVNKNKFRGIGNLGRIKTRLLRSLSFAYQPVSTKEIHNEVEKWGKEKMSDTKLRETLKELSDMGYLIQTMKGNCYFWITLPNYEKYRRTCI